MIRQVRSDHSAVPLPAILGVCRRVNPHPAAAGPNEILQRRFLRRVRQHVAGGAEENDRPILGEISISESRRIFRRIHGKPISRAKRLNGGDPVGDRSMPKSRRRRKDEDLIGRLTFRRKRENRNQECNQDLNHSTNVLLYGSHRKSPVSEG
jgi:hypothetical protein